MTRKTKHLSILSLLLGCVFLNSCDKEPSAPGNNGGFINYNVRIDYGFSADSAAMKDAFTIKLIEGVNASQEVKYTLKQYSILVDGRATNDSLYYIDRTKNEVKTLSQGVTLSFTSGTGEVSYYLSDYKPGDNIDVEWTVECSIVNINKSFTYTNKDSDRDMRKGAPVRHVVVTDWKSTRYGLTSEDVSLDQNNDRLYLPLRFPAGVSSSLSHTYKVVAFDMSTDGINWESADNWYIELLNGESSGLKPKTFNTNQITPNRYLQICIQGSPAETTKYRLQYTDQWSDEVEEVSWTYKFEEYIKNYTPEMIVISQSEFVNPLNTSHYDGHTTIIINPGDELRMLNKDFRLEFMISGKNQSEDPTIKATCGTKKIANLNNCDNLYVNFSKEANQRYVDYSSATGPVTYDNCYLIELSDALLNDIYTIACNIYSKDDNKLFATLSGGWREPNRGKRTLHINITLSGDNMTYSIKKPTKEDGILIDSLRFKTRMQISQKYGWGDKYNTEMRRIAFDSNSLTLFWCNWGDITKDYYIVESYRVKDDDFMSEVASSSSLKPSYTFMTLESYPSVIAKIYQDFKAQNYKRNIRINDFGTTRLCYYIPQGEYQAYSILEIAPSNTGSGVHFPEIATPVTISVSGELTMPDLYWNEDKKSTTTGRITAASPSYHYFDGNRTEWSSENNCLWVEFYCQPK